MLNQLIKRIYQWLPSSTIKRLGKSSFLKPIRNFILRTGNEARLLEVKVNWDELVFTYKGDIKSAIKAERKGIESSLLRLSNRLLKEKKNISDSAIVFDVGTSYGFLSTVWAMTSARIGKVYGFEASQNVYDVAEKTRVDNNLQNIQYINKAIFNYDGEIVMNGHDGTRASVASEIGNSSIKIPCIKLDTFVAHEQVKRVDLLKIDVDGPEFEVLQGATNMIIRDKPIIIVETNGNMKIAEWLINMKYSLFDMMKNSYSMGKELPPNLLALPNQE